MPKPTPAPPDTKGRPTDPISNDNNMAIPKPKEVDYKQYVATFMDSSDEPHRWVLIISYPDTEDTHHHPHRKEVRLGVPPVMLNIERESALSPIAEGRLSFSLLQEEQADAGRHFDYRHLMQSPEGSVSVALLRLPSSVQITSTEDLLRIPDELGLYLSDTWERGWWRGTLDPESYREPASQHSGYLVAFEACDFGRLKRIELRAGDERMQGFLPRMELTEFIASLVSLALSDPEWAYIYSSDSIAREHGRSYVVKGLMAWCADHFTDWKNKLFVETAPFLSDEDKPITAFEALDRVLRAFTLSIEQAEGNWVITDPSTLQSAEEGKYNFSTQNEDAYLDLVPEDLVPLGADGELSALPARGSLTLTTESHLSDAIPALSFPKMDNPGKWRLVPRADTRIRIPAWRYRMNGLENFDWTISGGDRVETEALSLGEDRDLYTVVWNPWSIHGRIDAPSIQNGQHTVDEWSIFRTDEASWEYAPDTGVYMNRALRAVHENGNIELLTFRDRAGWHYVCVNSFAITTIIPEPKLIGYTAYLMAVRDDLNSSLDTKGRSLTDKAWSFSVPRVADAEGMGLRLDLPLMVSMGQDLYQEYTDKTHFIIPISSTGPYGREYDRTEYLNEARDNLARIQEFTDVVTGCRIYFSLVARGDQDSDPVQSLGISVRKEELSWSDGENTTRLPYLSYGSMSKEGRLKWGASWNHPNIGQDEYLGEGLHIPLPPKPFTRLELTIYQSPKFYKLQGGQSVATHFQGWHLWSVPSIIALQAPALWVADPLGRRGQDLAPDRKERYRFTPSTDEDIEETLHLSDGTGLAKLSPSIVRTADGVALKDRERKSEDAFTQYTLAGYRAECFGALYGALPARGFELTGTFRYRTKISRARYMGLDWLAVSREIDIQQMSEKGTYHLLRPASSVRQESLIPEVIKGYQYRGETYDTSSPRYVDRGHRPPSRRR